MVLVCVVGRLNKNREIFKILSLTACIFIIYHAIITGLHILKLRPHAVVVKPILLDFNSINKTIDFALNPLVSKGIIVVVLCLVSFIITALYLRKNQENNFFAGIALSFVLSIFLIFIPTLIEEGIKEVERSNKSDQSHAIAKWVRANYSLDISSAHGEELLSHPGGVDIGSFNLGSSKNLKHSSNNYYEFGTITLMQQQGKLLGYKNMNTRLYLLSLWLQITVDTS